jgi:hypothetical protein
MDSFLFDSQPSHDVTPTVDTDDKFDEASTISPSLLSPATTTKKIPLSYDDLDLDEDYNDFDHHLFDHHDIDIRSAEPHSTTFHTNYRHDKTQEDEENSSLTTTLSSSPITMTSTPLQLLSNQRTTQSPYTIHWNDIVNEFQDEFEKTFYKAKKVRKFLFLVFQFFVFIYFY